MGLLKGKQYSWIHKDLRYLRELGEEVAIQLMVKNENGRSLLHLLVMNSRSPADAIVSVFEFDLHVIFCMVDYGHISLDDALQFNMSGLLAMRASIYINEIQLAKVQKVKILKNRVK